MKLVEVEEIPNVKRTYNHLQELLREFDASSALLVKCEWEGEYKNAESCSGCLHSAAKRGGWAVNVFKRGTSVYMAKKL